MTKVKSNGVNTISRSDFLHLRPKSQNNLEDSKSRETDVTEQMKPLVKQYLDADFTGKFLCGFWSHNVTPVLAKDIRENDSTVLCGELAYVSDRQISDTPLSNTNVMKLILLRTSNLGYGSSQKAKQLHAQLIKELYLSGVKIAATDTQYIKEAAEENLYSGAPSVFNIALLLAGAAGLAKGATGTISEVKKHNSEGESIDRRKFIISLGLLLGIPTAYINSVLGSLPDIQGQGKLDKKHSAITSLIPIQEKTEQMLQDASLIHESPFLEVEYIIKVRNDIMALNTWALMDKLTKDERLDENIHFFAGFMHGDVQNVLLEGPEVVKNRVEEYAQRILSEDFLNMLVENIEQDTPLNSNFIEAIETLSMIIEEIGFTTFTIPDIYSSNTQEVFSNNRMEMLEARVTPPRAVFMQMLSATIKRYEQKLACGYTIEDDAIFRALFIANAQIQKRSAEDYAYKLRLLEKANNTIIPVATSTVSNTSMLPHTLHHSPDKLIRLQTLNIAEVSRMYDYEKLNTSPIGILKINGIDTIVYRRVSSDGVGKEDSFVRYSDYFIDIDGKEVHINWGLYTYYKTIKHSSDKNRVSTMISEGNGFGLRCTLKDWRDASEEKTSDVLNTVTIYPEKDASFVDFGDKVYVDFNSSYLPFGPSFLRVV